MPLIPCPQCAAPISDRAVNCPKCGFDLKKPEQIKCTECGNNVDKSCSTCPECGIELKLSEAIQNDESKNNPKGDTNKCKWCGSRADEISEYCPNCGKNSVGLTKTNQTETPVQETVKVKRKRSGFKRFLIILLVLGLIGSVGFIILQSKGYSGSSLLNTPNTINISATCSSVTTLIIKSETTVTVSNSSGASYENVTAKIISYDANGNNIEEKTTVFDRTLGANSELSKPIFISANAVRCEAVVLNATPAN